MLKLEEKTFLKNVYFKRS